MRIIAFLLAVLIAAPAYSQITIGRYRVNGSIEFNADLTIEEVVPMMTVPDPIAFWKGDDLTSEYGSFDLTNVNGVTFTAGKIGNAFNLDRANKQYLKIPNNEATTLQQSSTDWIAGGGMTFAGWFYPATNPTVRHALVASGDGDYGGNDLGWMLKMGSDRKVTLAGRSNLALSSGGNLIVIGQWNFVAFRLDTDNVLTIWVNEGSNSGDFGGVALWDASVGDFNIGQASDGFYGGFGEVFDPAFNGLIDALGIWDTALSDAQIAALYNDGDGLELPIVTNATSFIPTYGTPALALATYGTSAAPIATMGVSKQ